MTTRQGTHHMQRKLQQVLPIELPKELWLIAGFIAVNAESPVVVVTPIYGSFTEP